MPFAVHYAAVSLTGEVRTHNEDNYSILGTYLPPSHDEGNHLLSGQVFASQQPSFALFDGMGGETAGAMASYTAAASFSVHAQKRPPLGSLFLTTRYINSVCLKINADVCSFAEREKIRSTGSTAAMICFSSRKAVWANLGDSRIYRITGSEITQLSTDHNASVSYLRKGPLTQYLGVPESEMQIEPACGIETLRPGLQYLLCSDGLTDLLDEAAIFSVLSKDTGLSDKIHILEKRIYENGATDNATIILCRISS